jgi:hypothetical protein
VRNPSPRGHSLSHSSAKTTRRPWHRPLTGLGLCIVTALAFTTLGCARAPAGPAFEAAIAPPPHRGRLYLYRADSRNSFSRVRVTVGGLQVGRFRDAEYETLELPAGLHKIRAGLRSLAGVAWGWNEQVIHLKPGESAFVEISVRLTERPQTGGRSLDIAGRTGGVASENVYLQRRSEKEALARIQLTTRLVP